MTHICVGKLTIIGSDNGLSPGPSHYLNQCWNIVNSTLRNKLQWNFNRNSNIFIQENAFESVVCETAVILSRPQCVNANSVDIPKRTQTIHKRDAIITNHSFFIDHYLLFISFSYFLKLPSGPGHPSGSQVSHHLHSNALAATLSNTGGSVQHHFTYRQSHLPTNINIKGRTSANRGAYFDILTNVWGFWRQKLFQALICNRIRGRQLLIRAPGINVLI